MLLFLFRVENSAICLSGERITASKVLLSFMLILDCMCGEGSFSKYVSLLGSLIPLYKRLHNARNALKRGGNATIFKELNNSLM